MTLLREGPLGLAVGQEAADPDPAPEWTNLARQLEQGEREAEAELAVRFHARVRTMALVRLHGSDVAADLAQETILAVLQALRARKLRELDRLPAFVLSVARNLINNHLRAQARSPEVLEDPPERPPESYTGLAELDEDRRVLVRKALKELNQLDRRILLLTLVEGMTPREIAPIVGLTPEVVRTRKSRAVKAITDKIKQLTRKRRWNHIGTSGREP